MSFPMIELVVAVDLIVFWTAGLNLFLRKMDKSLAEGTVLILVGFLPLEYFWRNLAVKYPELNWKRWDLH